jgi:hypothetical protein
VARTAASSAASPPQPTLGWAWLRFVSAWITSIKESCSALLLWWMGEDEAARKRGAHWNQTGIVIGITC